MTHNEAGDLTPDMRDHVIALMGALDAAVRDAEQAHALLQAERGRLVEQGVVVSGDLRLALSVMRETPRSLRWARFTARHHFGWPQAENDGTGGAS